MPPAAQVPSPSLWTASEVKVAQLCPTLCNTIECSLPGSSIMELSRQEYWSGLPWGSSQVRDRTQSPALQVDSLTTEPPGKPKNTGVGSLFLL